MTKRGKRRYLEVTGRRANCEIISTTTTTTYNNNNNNNEEKLDLVKKKNITYQLVELAVSADHSVKESEKMDIFLFFARKLKKYGHEDDSDTNLSRSTCNS